jgi:hypothetical protein
MDTEMKTERLVARIDKKTLEILNEASLKSGVPVSKIVREGALTKAVQILSMFGNKLGHVATGSQHKERNKS